MRRCRASLQDHIAGIGWNQRERNAHLADAALDPVAARAPVIIVYWRGNAGCPGTLELARRVDPLSAATAARDRQEGHGPPSC